MQSHHVAIFTEMGNGHINPLLPLISELGKRGHCVTYPCTDFFAQKIHESGGTPVCVKYPQPDEGLRSLMRMSFERPDDSSLWWKMGLAYESYVFRTTDELILQLYECFSRHTPDIILYDPYTLAGRILGNSVGCKVAQIRQHFVPRKGYMFRENGLFVNPQLGLDYMREMDQFLSERGIATKDNWWHTEDLSIQLIPREFQFCHEELDSRYKFVGALLNRQRGAKWEDRSGGRPIVLVSDLSGLQNIWENKSSYYRMFVDALRDSDHYYILSISRSIDPKSIGRLPSNFEINQDASHLDILPHADLLVCHGGMLSTLESLYNGVPVLGIPLSPGTEEVSFRTAELGLGHCLSRANLSCDVLSNRVHCMLQDASLSQRCKEAQHVFNQYGGEHLAADLVEAAMLGEAQRQSSQCL